MKKSKLFFLAILTIVTSMQVSAQNALHFDGSNDKVQTTYNGVLGSANRTFEAWVYITSTPSGNMAILDYGLNAVGSRNTFYINSSLKLGFISGGTNANISSSTGAITVNQWNHVAFVLNNGVGYLYVDGVQVGLGSLTTVDTPSGNGALVIGNRVSGGNIPFNGIIDEVRIWNVARSLSQIIADTGYTICPPQSGLAAYYQFDSGIAGGTNTGVTSAIDLAGASNNGTLTNFSLTGATSNWVTGKNLTPCTPVCMGPTQVLSGCDGFSVTVGTNTYTTTGVYVDTLAGNNCDSVVVLNLTIHPEYNTTDLQTACDSFTWADGNTYYASNNIATFVGQSVFGCDSVSVLDLTISNSGVFTDVQHGCGSFQWINGVTYTSDNNTAVDSLLNSNGCDSIVMLDLTIGQANSADDIIETCDSLTWIDGVTYYQNTANAYHTITNVSGCDSTVRLFLTIRPVNVSTTNNWQTITAGATGATYQWMDCSDNSLISGATSQSFTATQNGSYAVIVGEGSCIDTSECVNLTNVGIEENQIGTSISLFPNPTDGTVQITLGSEIGEVQVSVLDVSGKLHAELTTRKPQFEIDLSDFESGVYLVRFSTNQGQEYIRLIRN